MTDIDAKPYLTLPNLIEPYKTVPQKTSPYITPPDLNDDINIL